MSRVKSMWRRLLSMARRDDLDRDLDEEVQAHIALAADDYVRRGMPRADADRLARARFGLVGAAKAAHRDARGLPWLEGLVLDGRLALRGLRRDWTFTLAAVTMLALALGLNTAIFTVMDAMLFRGFPYVRDNGRLVYLQEHHRGATCCLSYADVEDWRAQARSFEALAFVGGGRPLVIRDAQGPIELSAFRVSTNLFGLLGVPPMLGRDFVPADEAPGAPQVAILTARFWESRFGKRPDIVGLQVEIDGLPATIVGVMPDGFDFPERKELWVPAVRSPELLRRGLTPLGFMAVGRLRDGVAAADARAELETINRRLELAYPETNRDLAPTVMSYSRLVSGSDAAVIWGSLWVGAWFVLLVACANAANLTLVRTIGRWRELATRLALGAGQARMVRQMLLESAVIVGIAAALAWAATVWCMGWWTEVTWSQHQVVDYRVTAGTAGYLVAVALLTTGLLALAPIVRVTQLGTSGALKGDARGVSQGLRAKHLAAGLVAGQMALAVVLLAGAGVLVRSFQAIVGAETGVREPANVLFGLVRLSSVGYPDAAARRGYLDRLEARLQAVPGVAAAAIAYTAPMKGARLRPIEVGGYDAASDVDEPMRFAAVAPDYFRVLGIEPSAGRAFTAADRASSQPVAIVNERFAARYWPGESAIGKRLRTPSDARGDHQDADSRAADGRWRVVVGVVPYVEYGDATHQQPAPIVFVPFQQEGPGAAAYLLVRPGIPIDQAAGPVREAVRAVDPEVRLDTFSTLEASFAFNRDNMDMDHSELGKYSKVAPTFAAIALLLAALGLAAVIAHAVGQRTKEIGVRMAIGAAARDIVGLIVGEGMRPVAIGLAAGTVAALAVNRVLQSQLVGISPYDPPTLAGALTLLACVAAVACWAPARRAARVDPMVALRHE